MAKNTKTKMNIKNYIFIFIVILFCISIYIYYNKYIYQPQVIMNIIIDWGGDYTTCNFYKDNYFYVEPITFTMGDFMNKILTKVISKIPNNTISKAFCVFNNNINNQIGCFDFIISKIPNNQYIKLRPLINCNI